MRGLQPLRQCLPGRRLHHDGGDGPKQAVTGERATPSIRAPASPIRIRTTPTGRRIRTIRRIRSLENSIREDEKLLAAGTDDRRAVERRIDDNRRTIRDLDRDIGRMESDLRRIEDDMEDFRYRAAPLSQG
jgi:septal ring factor EnvC (AmiA/AmiB activator)